MRRTKKTYIDGSMAVEHDLTIGGNQKVKGSSATGGDKVIGRDLTVRGHARICHDLKVEGWLEAGNVKLAYYKGLFATKAALTAAYPDPGKGWWALVGDTLPAEVYTVECCSWMATGGKGGEMDLNPLVVKQVYRTITAMEADTSPTDTKGRPLRYGDLVMVNDPDTEDEANGSLYLWQHPGWKYLAALDVRNATETVKGVTEILDPKTDFAVAGDGSMTTKEGVYGRVMDALVKGKRILVYYYRDLDFNAAGNGVTLIEFAGQVSADLSLLLLGGESRVSGSADTDGEVEQWWQQFRILPAGEGGVSMVEAVMGHTTTYTGEDREANLFLNKQGKYTEAGMTDVEKKQLGQLYEKVFPVTLSASCTPNLVLKGSSNKVIFKATLNSDIGASLTSCKQGNDVMEVSTDKRSATISYEGVTADTTYHATAETSAGQKTAGAGVRFVNPTYFGVVAGGFTGELFTADTLSQKLVVGQKAYTTPPFTQTAQKCVYAYPASFGELSGIQDANGTPLKNSFTRTTRRLDFGGGNSEDYHVYVLTDPSSVTNYVLKFS